MNAMEVVASRARVGVLRKIRLALPIVLSFAMAGAIFAQNPTDHGNGQQFPPQARNIQSFPPLNFAAAAEKEKKNPPKQTETEIEGISAPELPPNRNFHVPIPPGLQRGEAGGPLAPSASATGVSPSPTQSFLAEYLTGPVVPPDTMGAVGTSYIVTVSNDRIRIQTRDGVQVSRVTLSSFWSGVTIKGIPLSVFDPRILYDRFNNRYIFVAAANNPDLTSPVSSGALFAVSKTSDPTGDWYRWSVAVDPSSTGAPNGSGKWFDYPSVGFNKNWIVVDGNVFSYSCGPSSCSSLTYPYYGQQLYVLDKQAAYSNTLGTINAFSSDFVVTCQNSATKNTELGCGFSMVPAITEDNSTGTEYLIEDWNGTAGQLRLSKITGTPSSPVLTAGTQFPQSTYSWRFDAKVILNSDNSSTGGYMPQRNQRLFTPSGTRIALTDSRLQNAVLRNGTLWTVHTVMLSSSAQSAGTPIGGSGNPVDNHTGIQWWQIDPTTETGAATTPLQRGRIEDPTANNCHNGNGGTSTTSPCAGNTSVQFGEFFAFPNISVNQNNDVVIGYTTFSPFTYPNSGYSFRASGDTPNLTRDRVVFRPGQANYSIRSKNITRWGDYSASQTDPLNDTDFWMIQEYAGTQRNDIPTISPNYAAPWETWWTKISPTNPAGINSGLIIDEFRLRGPQGARDEFIKLYNPASAPVIVSTSDNSDGWMLAYSTNGTNSTPVAVIPNGTVIPPQGYLLIADSPDSTGDISVVYSLGTYPGTAVRTATSDTGYAVDIPDNAGIALFSTANTANFNSTTRLDSVGFTGLAVGLFKEGNGLAPISTTSPTGQSSFVRKMSAGVPVDSGANENDFVLIDPVLESLGVTPLFGAAGPQNLDGPGNLPNTTDLLVALVDTGVIANAAPNRVRGASTLTFRRAYTNNTTNPITTLRFRVFDMTAGPASPGTADLRLTSSVDATVTTSGGSANIKGLTLETPPTQAAGGGLNSTLSLPLPFPLAPAATVNVEFLMNISQQGNYRFGVVPETFPRTGSAVSVFTGTTADSAPGAVNDNYVTAPNTTLNVVAPGVLVNDSDPDGDAMTAVLSTTTSHGALTLNSNGSFTYTPTAAYTGPDSFTYKASDGTLQSSSATVSINVANVATHFSVTAASSANAGSLVSVTVTALDASNNTFTGYNGTVHFTSSDAQAVLPTDYTFIGGDNGAHTFSFTPKTSGTQTITATDTGTSITGTSGNIAIAPTTATMLSVSAPTSATAGSPISVTVTAKDAYNNTATGYSGTVHFTSTDGQAVLPTNYNFNGGDNGAHTFSVTLKTAGSQTVTATDTVTGSIHGTSGSVVVAAATASTFAFSAPTSVTAGATFNATVTAKDAFNNTVTGYVGTVHFTTSDAQAAASMPTDYTFLAGDNGVHTTSFVLKTPGSQTLTATDTVTPSITGTSGNITVTAPAASTFVLNVPSSATAGTPFTVTVTAKDAFNGTVTGYTGTVHFTSSDAQAVVPADYTFVPSDNGAHTFTSAFTLKTAGARTLTATDTVTASITGTSGNINVAAGAATSLLVSAPSTAGAGITFNFTVTAKDAFNNTATGYGGTVHFTSTDGSATLPANATLTSGTATFAATLRTLGSQTITATDTVTLSITGTSSSITVGTPPSGCQVAILGGLVVHDKTANAPVADPALLTAGHAVDGIQNGWTVNSSGLLINSTGTAEPTADLLIYDAGGLSDANFCFNNGNTITVTLNGVVTSPTPAPGVPTAPSNVDVYDSNGAAGLTISTSSSATSNQTAITITVTQAGTTGSGPIFPSSGTSGGTNGSAIRIKNLMLDANTVSGSTVTVAAAQGVNNAPIVNAGNLASQTTVATKVAGLVRPVIATSFNVPTIPLNGTALLTITLSNNNTATTLNGVTFFDNLPSGLVVGNPPALSNNCGSAVNATAGSNAVFMSTPATMASNTSCTVSVNVTGTIAGTMNNSVAVLSSTTGYGNTATGSIIVVSPPTIAKSFGPASIPLNATTTLSFTIQNNNAVTLSGVAFTDTFPAGLVVATPNGLRGSCGGGTITATEGTGSVSLSAATLSGGASCTFWVNVTGTSTGTLNNVTDNVTSTEGGTGGTASANVVVGGSKKRRGQVTSN